MHRHQRLSKGGLAALLGGVAYCGLLLAVFAYGDCRHADELTASGVGLETPRSRFCGALPLGAIWWFAPAVVPLALTLVTWAATRHRMVPSVVVGAVAVLVAAVLVVALHDQSTAGTPSP